MRNVCVFLNDEYWRTEQIPGMNDHFQIRITNPGDGPDRVDVYVQHDIFYYADIKRPNLEPDPDNEYNLIKVDRD